MVDRDANFNKPQNFDDRLSEVMRRIASLSMKTNTHTGGMDTDGGYGQH